MLEHRRREPDDAAEKWRDFDARYPVALRRLTAAYQAVVEQRGLAERVAEGERQAAALVGAAEARVRSLDQPLLDLGTTLTITLPGGLGELDVSAPRGHIWRPGDEAALEQFAALVESPINDARLLTLTSRLHRVGSLLETADDPAAVVGGFLDDGLQLCGARYGVVLLREGNVLRVVGARSSG